MQRPQASFFPKRGWPLGVLLAAVAANVLALGVIYVLSGNLPYSQAYAAYKRAFFKSNLRPCKGPHPFFGNVNCDDLPIEGQFSSGEPLLRVIGRSPNAKPVKVLVLGGSLAAHLSRNASSIGIIAPAMPFQGSELDYQNILQKMLNRHFGTDRIEVHNAALPGGKEPQQLFKLLYLLTMGQSYDVVFNVDGFNELALPWLENQKSGDWTAYPRSYSRLIQSASIGHDVGCIGTSNQYANSVSFVPIIEAWQIRVVQKCHRQVEAFSVGPDNPLAKVVKFTAADQATVLDESVRVWRESSRSIAKLSQAYGFDYIHVIQPNQYVQGSKPLSEEERTRFTSNRHYGDIISRHYRRLDPQSITAGIKEVTVLDLREVFKSNEMTLYRDDCCHLNNAGIALMSLAIAERSEGIFKRRLNR